MVISTKQGDSTNGFNQQKQASKGKAHNCSVFHVFFSFCKMLRGCISIRTWHPCAACLGPKTVPALADY